MKNTVLLSLRVDQARHDELAQIALVESIEKRRRVSLCNLIRRALDAAYPTAIGKEDRTDNSQTLL